MIVLLTLRSCFAGPSGKRIRCDLQSLSESLVVFDFKPLQFYELIFTTREIVEFTVGHFAKKPKPKLIILNR